MFSSFVKGDTTSIAYIVIFSFNKSHEYFSVATRLKKNRPPAKTVSLSRRRNMGQYIIDDTYRYLGRELNPFHSYLECNQGWDSSNIVSVKRL